MNMRWAIRSPWPEIEQIGAWLTERLDRSGAGVRGGPDDLRLTFYLRRTKAG